MITLELTATVTKEGLLAIEVPTSITPGKHKVIMIIDEKAEAANKKFLEDFPVHNVGSWPNDISLRREDIYSDEE
jgi:hypothetical protein